MERVQLATALAAGVRVSECAGTDRGPWPLWFRVALGALVLAAGVLAGRLVCRRAGFPVVRSVHVRLTGGPR